MMSKSAQDNQLPIAVIGAGIVGVSTAIWLQRAGFDVVLIDREGPAAGTSYGNGGVLASCGVVPINSPGLMKIAPSMLMNPNSPLFIRWSYLPKMIPWLVRYLARTNSKDATQSARALTEILYDSLEQHTALAKGTKAERWLIPSDYVFIYESRKAFEKEKFGWDMRKKMGFVWDEMEAEEFSKYDPVFANSDKFAIRLKNHGHIKDPGKYVADLSDHFVEQGGKFLKALVQDVEISNGTVSALITSEGKIKCSKLVLAAGVWSSGLARKLGINASMESERGYHIELINPSIMPRAPMMNTAGKFVITPMDGRLRCAGIVEFGGLDAPASKAPINLLKKQIHDLIPNLTYDSVEQWMGHRPAPSDSIPFIGPSKTVAGTYAAFGHHHIGLSSGPKTGRIIANMIAGIKNNIELAPYEVSRFTH